MSRISTVVFSSIWLVTAVTFGILTVDSKESEGTTLARYSTSSPEYRVQFSGVDVATVVNEMSATTNSNISALEESIRHTARLTFWLNLISCVAATFGFFAQVADYINDRRSADQGGKQRQKHGELPHSVGDPNTSKGDS